MKQKRNTIALWSLGVLLLAGCQQKPIRYTPPPPIRYLDKRDAMSPKAIARTFFEHCLQQKAYRCFLSLSSHRLLIEGPDKEHFLEALPRYAPLQSHIVSANSEIQGRKAKVKLLLSSQQGQKAATSITMFLVKESAIWRVDRLSPPLPYISFNEIGRDSK